MADPSKRSADRRHNARAALTVRVAALVVALTPIAAVGPETSSSASSQSVFVAGQAVAPAAPSDDPTAVTESSSNNPRADSAVAAASAAVRVPGLGPVDELPVPTAPPSPSRDNVFVIGDSVMLGAQREVPKALDDWNIVFDAVGSRRLAQGIDVLAERHGEVGRVLVVMFGNNLVVGERGGYGHQIDEVMAMFGELELAVWFTVAETSDSRVELNRTIRGAAQRHENVVVADWAPMIAANPHFAADDRLHLGPAGARAMAALIRSTMDEAGVQPTGF